MKRKKIGILLSLTMTASLLFGCSGSSDSTSTATSESAYDSSYYSTDSYDSYDWDEEYESVSNTEAMTDSNTQTAAELSQKLVYSGSVEMETKEYDEAVAAIKDSVESYGGFIEYEYESNTNYSWYYDDDNQDDDDRTLSLTVRIPSAKYQEFYDGLSDIAKVMKHTSNVENITQSYNTYVARIEALQKEEERLLAMMEQAETIEDMIYVEERLAEVESDISVYETSKRSMDLDVAYSTVSIELEEVQELRPSSNVEETFLYKVKEAFFDGWAGLATLLEDLVIFLLEALPVLLFLALVVFIVVKNVKSYKKKHPEGRKKNNRVTQPYYQQMQPQGMPNQNVPNPGMPNQGMPNQNVANPGVPPQGMPNQNTTNQGVMPGVSMPKNKDTESK